MQSANLYPISTGEPTYWPSDKNKIPDLLDFAVVKGINSQNITAETCLDLSSDHSPVMITLNKDIKIQQKVIYLYNKKTNWKRFKECLTDSLTCNISLKTPKDLEKAVEELNIQIYNAVSVATPLSDGPKKTATISKHILEKILEKRQLRKIWQITRSKFDKTKLNKFTKELKLLLIEEKNIGIQKYLESLSPTEASDYSLWKATWKFKRPQQHIPSIRQLNGDWARNDLEKANTFAEHLGEVFQPINREISEQEESELSNYADGATQENQPIKKVKINEVLQIIKALKDSISPGYDKINGKIIKELPLKATRYLTIIINAVFRIGYFPKQWKTALVILIPKPGKSPDVVTSYRPISLLPIISKICEKLILKRMNLIITSKKLIPNHQFGFRDQHATIEQVNRLTNKIKEAFENKQYCAGVFLDIAQAFDKVWHQGLLIKLRNMFSNNLYKLLKSYLTDRTFQVKINATTTKLTPINAGVPQGSVLGPTLFLLYTADLPTMQGVVTATYADDTAILTSHSCPRTASEILQVYIDKTNTWFKRWRIKINETKSSHVTFTLRKGTCPVISLNNKNIPQTNEVKYLGIHLDRRLTWRTHIWTKRKQLNLKLRKLYWLIGTKSKLKLENKILIYKCIIKPVWTYGIQLWGSASKSNIEIIERFQSKALRNLLGAPWYVPNATIIKDLNIPTVKEEITTHFRRYKNRLAEHPNQLAANLHLETRSYSRLKKYKNITI